MDADAPSAAIVQPTCSDVPTARSCALTPSSRTKMDIRSLLDVRPPVYPVIPRFPHASPRLFPRTAIPLRSHPWPILPPPRHSRSPPCLLSGNTATSRLDPSRTRTREAPMCSKCGKIFKSKQGVNRHNHTVHLKLRPYKCADCSASFGQKCSLQRHQRKVHNKKHIPFECEHQRCATLFPNYRLLQSHIKEAHNGESPFRCHMPACAAEFMWRSSHTSHLKVDHGLLADTQLLSVDQSTESCAMRPLTSRISERFHS